MSVISNVYNKVSTLWYNEKDATVLAQSKEILEIGNTLAEQLVGLHLSNLGAQVKTLSHTNFNHEILNQTN